MSDRVTNKRPPPGRPFKPGNPGRPKGSRNVLSESFIAALHRDFQAHGAEAIAAARAESPLAYLKIIVALLPAKLDVAKATGMSDAQLIAIILAASEDAAVDGVPEPTVEDGGTA